MFTVDSRGSYASWVDSGTSQYSKSHRKDCVKGLIGTSVKIYITTYILGTDYEAI